MYIDATYTHMYMYIDATYTHMYIHIHTHILPLSSLQHPAEVAILLDSIFMGKVLGRNITVSVNASNFPRFFQQMSVQAKEVTSDTKSE